MTRSQATPISSQMMTMGRMISERDDALADTTAQIAELEQLREQAYGRAEYWKAEHLAGNEQIAKLEARIAELEAPSQEPVAWRIRCTDPEREWVILYRYPKAESKFSNMEIQPLYPHPSDAAAQIAELKAENETLKKPLFSNRNLIEQVVRQEQQIAKLQFELAEAREDAERYRWLCNWLLTVQPSDEVFAEAVRKTKSLDEFDAAIDAAMEQSK